MTQDAQLIRKVNGIATSDGAGVKLTRIIGQPLLQNLDPFLMLDEFGSEQAADYLAGFPSHPHRGFQTVTYMLNGRMRHRDSNGNDGVIEAGGIQWMNAGKGIIHEEMPEQSEGLLRGFQLWVNLPASHKLSEPQYQDIQPHDVPEFSISSSLNCRLLSGALGDKVGPVSRIDKALAQPFFADFEATEVGQAELELALNYQYFLYVYEGQLNIDDKVLRKGELGVLSAASGITLRFSDDARWILVGGAPLREPVAQYGPFVMNSQSEIEQAVRDYQAGVLTH